MLLKLAHVRQQQQADCLVACAAMVLDHLHVPMSYSRIRQALGTTSEGTPFSRLSRLQSVGLKIMRGEGSLPILRAYLSASLPIIVDVDTSELPYWQMRTDIPENERATAHAIVIVGIEDQALYAYDPDIEEAPQVIGIGDFELAWLIRDYRYAVIRS
jgi:ABC-type bacteriocin/lantibiotic exporter with double-glycine peptidase domain